MPSEKYFQQSQYMSENKDSKKMLTATFLSFVEHCIRK